MRNAGVPSVTVVVLVAAAAAAGQEPEWHLADAVPFTRSLRFVMERGLDLQSRRLGDPPQRRDEATSLRRASP